MRGPPPARTHVCDALKAQRLPRRHSPPMTLPSSEQVQKQSPLLVGSSFHAIRAAWTEPKFLDSHHVLTAGSKRSHPGSRSSLRAPSVKSRLEPSPPPRPLPPPPLRPLPPPDRPPLPLPPPPRRPLALFFPPPPPPPPDR